MVFLTPLVAPAVAAPELRSFGVSIDAAAPSGAAAGIVVRPARPLRIGLAVTSVGVGFGGRLDMNLRTTWKVAPTLNVAAGLVPPFDGNASLAMFGLPVTTPLLDRIAYQWASGQVGLDFGNGWAVVSLSLGAAVIGLQTSEGEGTVEGFTVRYKPLTARALLPSARVGLVFWLPG